LINRLFRDYFELIFWLGALIALGLSDPTQASHYTLCPLKLMGITWCPGCGLGHSIAWLLHGDIPRSWHAHWLGIPALIVIVYRIYDLAKQRVINKHPVMPNLFRHPTC
jgi:putative exporter of polyketide antibiotics